MTKVRGSYDDYYNNPNYRKSLRNLIKYEKEQKRKEKKEAEDNEVIFFIYIFLLQLFKY